MALFDLPRPDYLKCGVKARLIPSGADSNRECRTTSILLATMMSVEEFGKGLLGTLGVRVGKTAKIQGFTEVVFNGDLGAKLRPDGLLIVTTGSREWKALIECKIGRSELNKEQVESYLDLCKEHGIDAVITISNHSTANSTHHPLQIGRNKLRNASVYHWCWMHLITEAIMWTKHYGVADRDQGYILSEFVRYLQHPSSGISTFDRMNSGWRDICATIQNGMPTNRCSPEVMESVSSWHQFVRSVSLEMSVAVGQSVSVPLRREHLADSNRRLTDDCCSLTEKHILTTEFDVPNAASRIRFSVDFQRRSANCSMRLKAPEDKVRAKPRINWLLNQFRNVPEENLLVRISWPSRAPDTFASLKDLKVNPDCVISGSTNLPPIAFEIVMSKDLAGRFKGAQTFVQDSQDLILHFYQQVGQHLRAWVAPPPRVSFSDPGKILEGTVETRAHDEPVIAPTTSDEQSEQDPNAVETAFEALGPADCIESESLPSLSGLIVEETFTIEITTTSASIEDDEASSAFENVLSEAEEEIPPMR